MLTTSAMKKSHVLSHQKMHGLSLTVAALLLLVGKTSIAATFDFESLPTSSGGAHTSLMLTDSGLTMTLTRNGGTAFDIFDLSPFAGPPSFGMRTLDPFQAGEFGPGHEFVADFSSAVSSVGINFGDYDADDDTFEMRAYSGAGGTGMLLDTFTLFWPATNTFPGDVGFGSVSGAGIMSVVFTSTGTFNNSFYYDNIITTPMGVPEGGATAILLGLSFAGFALFQRFLRSRGLAC